MTPDQIIEAAKLINARKQARKKLDDIEGRMTQLGVSLDEPKAEAKGK